MAYLKNNCMETSTSSNHKIVNSHELHFTIMVYHASLKKIKYTFIMLKLVYGQKWPVV